MTSGSPSARQLLAGLFLGCLALAAPAAAQDGGATGVADPPAVKQGIETFDRAWELVRDRHFDPEMGGVDWDAVRTELRPKAEAAQSLAELRAIISDMLGRLGLSHFSLLPMESVDALEPSEEEKAAPAESAGGGSAGQGSPGDAAPEPDPPPSPGGPGDAGFETRLVEGKMLVTGLDAEGPAAAAGVKPGWALLAINGRLLQERLDLLPADMEPKKRAFYAMRIVQSRLEGEAGSKVLLRFHPGGEGQPGGEGDATEVTLRRQPRKGQVVRFGNLPPVASFLTQRWIEEGQARIGYIYFNIWMVPLARAIDKAVDDYRGADGIVLDLRGNPGGVGGMSMGVAGHFLDKRVKLGTMKTRNNDMMFKANPRRVNHESKRVEPFGGPLAILVDGATGSTSEIFAAGIQFLGRARVFGQTSMGAALPAMMERLPNGDVLLHAVGDYVLPDGSHIEGKGVVPDEPVQLSQEALLADPDPVLSAARRWIAAQQAQTDEAPASQPSDQ